MAAEVHSRRSEPWVRRLYLPTYGVSDAARYARSSTQTVAYWHYGSSGLGPALPGAERRQPLSYLQLVEVAFVATFRKLGVSLQRLRATPQYVAQTFTAEHPFAEYRFKTEGHHVLMELSEHEPRARREFNKSIIADAHGQLAWDAMLADKFAEFDYEGNGLAIRWHVAGRQSPVVIDPRVAFGAPLVSGVPTWVLKGRWAAGESVTEITEDFGVSEEETEAALRFEGVDLAA